jgi:hypothetical protein
MKFAMEPLCALSQDLARDFCSFFEASPRAKFRVARFLASQLPPLSRPHGRPGYPMVSNAISLREELHRLHPESSDKAIRHEIYNRTIPKTLPVIERRASQDQLRKRVYWRLSARRRRQRRGKSPTDLST